VADKLVVELQAQGIIVGKLQPADPMCLPVLVPVLQTTVPELPLAFQHATAADSHQGFAQLYSLRGAGQ
jgi:hypothetical protein